MIPKISQVTDLIRLIDIGLTKADIIKNCQAEYLKNIELREALNVTNVFVESALADVDQVMAERHAILCKLLPSSNEQLREVADEISIKLAANSRPRFC